MKNLKHNIKRLLSSFYPVKNLSENLVILTYHSVNPNYLFSVKPEKFEEQIRFLSENFNLINLKNFSLEKVKKTDR